ncbi:MAG: PAS domain-containing protein, partial [Myxococcales bacterium]|nr:PAS domain-containing protein [Myxococcales bacterium]
MDRSIVLLAVGVASGGLTGSSLVVVTFVASWVALTVGFALGRRMAPPPEERGTPSDIELSLDLLDTPAWIERPDGTLAGMNPSLRQLLNHPGPFEDTASLLAAVPTASGHHVPMPPREGRFVGRPFELLDGRCAELRRTRMPDGRALWKLRDVTAERDLARAAAATFRKLNAVLDVVDQPVCVKDDAFRVLACNEAYARLVSGTRSWLVGHGPDDTGAPAALVTQREDDERALLTWMEYRTEEPTSGGEPVRTRIVPIRGAGGRPLLVRVSAWTNAVQGEDLPEEPEVTQGTWSWSIERGVLLDPCCDLLLGYRLVRAPSQLALVLRELVRSADHLPLWRAVGSLVSARASEVDALVRPRHRQDA